jgi:hypothetical protein
VQKRKKISTNVPEGLLDEACKVSKLNQTDALVEGLRQLIRAHERRRVLTMRGKIQFEEPTLKRERVRL